VSLAPYAYRADGVFAPTGSFSGYPLYQRTDQHDNVWSLYYRGGRWVLDSNAVENRWSGTVAFTPQNAPSNVWDAPRFNGDNARRMMVSIVSEVASPPPAPTSTPPVYVQGDGLPYRYRTAGVYWASGGPAINGAPVYTRTDSRGLQWSLYRRGNGMWVFDYNAVENRWSGTVAYSQRDRTATVRDAVWSRAITITDVPAGARARTSEWLAAMALATGAPPLDVMMPDEEPHEEPEPLAKPDPMHLSELHDTPDPDAINGVPAERGSGSDGTSGGDGAGNDTAPEAASNDSAAAETAETAATDATDATDDADVEAVAAPHASNANGELVLFAGGAAALATLALALSIVVYACRRQKIARVQQSKPTGVVVEAKQAQVHRMGIGGTDVTSATSDVESGVRAAPRAVEIPHAVSEELSRRSATDDATSPRRLSFAHL